MTSSRQRDRRNVKLRKVSVGQRLQAAVINQQVASVSK